MRLCRAASIIQKNDMFYLVPKYYEPDFVYKYRTKTIYIEAKGRFRTSEEARKYVIISETLSPKEELVFLFQRPNTPCRDHEEEKTVHVTQWQNGQTKTDSSWYTMKQYLQGGEDDQTPSNT